MFVRGVMRAVCIAVTAAAVLSACGSRTTGSSTIPGTPSGLTPSGSLRSLVANSGAIAINAGGAAAGGFAADTGFAAGGTWTYATTAAIDTSAIVNPAPQSVYADDREGPSIAYTIPGLTAGGAYTVRLSFSELWWTAAGKRTFNVAINNTNVLTNFDVFAAAGGRFKAINRSFNATAGSTGTIAIALHGVTDNAAIDAIEVIPATGATPGPTSPPSSAFAIHAGGDAAGAYVADTDYTAAGTWTYGSTSSIATSGVTNPAPQAVYQRQRTGGSVRYTIPSLTPGAAYSVRLDFAELYFAAAGQRVFNVSINNVNVLSNFDIVAVAGGRNTAVSRTFNTTASSTGSIGITLSAVTNYAVLNGIVVSGGGSVPTPPPATSFNDYPTFGYDNGRDVFNPNSAAITPANLNKLHLAWQANVADYNTQTQPILATGIGGRAGMLFVGGGTGNMYGYDALTGKRVWMTRTGQMSYSACGSNAVFGIGGTAAYDAATKSLYVVGNSNASSDAYASNTLFRLDAASGTILGSVNFAPRAAGASEQNFGHTAVTLNGGVAYVGTGTTCDISSWRGRIAAIDVPSMTLANTFFTLWDPNNTRGHGAQPWSGGGIWGWGGVSLDANGNVFTGVGNADNFAVNGKILAPFVPTPKEYSGYAETLLELTPNVSSVVASQHPIPTNSYTGQYSNDLDVQGTPLIFRPNGTGCDTMIAVQGKSGELTIYNERSLSGGYAAQYNLSPSTYDDGYLGDPAFSPVTGLVYADVESSVSPTLYAPGLIAVDPGCGRPSVAWHASFGNDSSAAGLPRSVPAVSAGGVVFVGSVNGHTGDVWAIDASTGSVLNGGTPLLQTNGTLRMPATIDGNWVFILDNSGNLYGLTLDASYPRISPTARAFDPRSAVRWARRRE